MTSSDEHRSASDDNLFEKSGGSPEKQSGRGKLPVGALAAILFTVLVVLGIVLFLFASGGGSGSNGQTTGIVLLSLL